MALSITVLDAVLDEPQIVELISTFQRRSATNVEHRLGTFIQFSSIGELKFTSDAYALANAYGSLMYDGTFYAILQITQMNDAVPVAWSGSEDSKGASVSYQDYFRRSPQLNITDDLCMFRVQKANNTALTNEDRLLFEATLGTYGIVDGTPVIVEGRTQLLTKAEGESLKPLIDRS